MTRPPPVEELPLLGVRGWHWGPPRPVRLAAALLALGVLVVLVPRLWGAPLGLLFFVRAGVDAALAAAILRRVRGTRAILACRTLTAFAVDLGLGLTGLAEGAALEVVASAVDLVLFVGVGWAVLRWDGVDQARANGFLTLRT